VLFRSPGFVAADYEVSKALVPSKDGSVAIPAFIVRRRAPPAPASASVASGAPPAPAKCLLYGYGGFSISMRPGFSASRLHWLGECGGVFVLACLRGGGEYGEAWHEAGTLTRKQNVFDDAHAVAEHLIATGVTAPRSLGIMGGSNGGLLVLAAVQQRPELFGAGVAQVPVADMLRFHKFTVGSLWRGEYGFAESNAAEFAALRAYSPLHNVRVPRSAAAQLPSLLVTTADHDDRVVPLHSFKVIAELQAVAGASPLQRRPLLIRIEEKAGHGAGKPTAKVLDELADIYAFLAHELAPEREAELAADAAE
jgi:prolyl oligopeptidase